MRIERSSKIQQKRRFDDIRVTDDGHRFLPMVPSQILQRVRHTRLDVQHQFSFGCVCNTSQRIEAGPVSVAFEICDALPLPHAEIDFGKCIENTNLLTEAGGQWLSRFPSPLERAAVHRRDCTVLEPGREFLCLFPSSGI